MVIYIQWASPATSHNGMSNLPYLNVNINARTSCNPRYAKFPCRLAKVAQTVPKRADLAMMLLSPWRRIMLPCCSVQRWVHFVSHDCYISAYFLQTPLSTSNLTIYTESQWTVDSNNILSVRKYSHVFTHESNTFLFQKYAIQINGTEKSPKPPLALGARGPPNNTWMPKPTALTTPNCIHIQSATVHSLDRHTDRTTDGPQAIDQSGRCIQNRLKSTCQVGRKANQNAISIVQPRMHQCDN